MHRRRHVGYILLSALTVSLCGRGFGTTCQQPPSSIDSTPGACTKTSVSVLISKKISSCKPLPICIPAVWYVTWTVYIPTYLPDVTSIFDADEYSGSGELPKQRAPRSLPKQRAPRSYQSYINTSRIMTIGFVLFNSTNNSAPEYGGIWNNVSDTRERVNQSLGIYLHPENGTITTSGHIPSEQIDCEVIVCINPTTTTSSQTQVPSIPPLIRSTPSPSKSTESHTTPKVTTRKDVTISKIYSSTTAASTTSSITSSHVTSRTTSHAIAPSTTASHTEDEIVHTAIDEEEFVFLHSGHISINSDSNVLLIVAMSLLWIYIFI
ncbi:m15 protein [Murid betaherpesvirus 1]|uniref:M15 protein n=1 Tax=Murid herpesvirus 1 TaxID=10366 RepID=H2A2K9_MUHV1|nr:m15 protein [Murid betaherpesvirus 1]